MEIAWSDRFAVGHKELDSEHACLVETVNAIYRAAADSSQCEKVYLLLDELLTLTTEHFKHENSVMRQIGSRPIPLNVDRLSFIAAVADAQIDTHISGHSHALRDLHSIIGEIRKTVNGGACHLSSDLIEWFVVHMTEHDAQLKPIFAALKHR
jgi:hemerythrin